VDSTFRERLTYLLQTVGQLEGRADDVADAIINEFQFAEEPGWIRGSADDSLRHRVMGWMPL